MNKINEAIFFLFKSEKKTDERHMKQMREGLRNNFFCLRYARWLLCFICVCTMHTKFQSGKLTFFFFIVGNMYRCVSIETLVWSLKSPTAR